MKIMLALIIDVRPDPVDVSLGIAGLLIIALGVLFLASLLIVGIVFLVKRRKKQPGAAPLVEPAVAAGVPQASKPNQL
jgi:hypothetical protein